MFRELVRKKQALPLEECVRILKEEPRGVLSVQGDDGYPYGTPLNHWYCEDNGRLYFHSGMSGHRIDALKRCDKVSFCVYDQGYRKEGDWALYIRSVIVFGRMRPVEDHEKAMEICNETEKKVVITGHSDGATCEAFTEYVLETLKAV
jgi:nitroimidazol reductase NimA-like FMN-containing flavoprotein (pyridoxamine 5'-phosphate oxidase superfamily)